MKKTIITLLLIIASVMFVTPLNTEALEVNNAVSVVSENFYIMETTVTDVSPNTECSGSKESILGDPTDDESVAWLVQLALNVLKVVGPALVIILSSIDFIKVIIKSDDEEMAKAQKKLIIRLILALLLFVIPFITQFLLQIFGVYSDPTCGLH